MSYFKEKEIGELIARANEAKRNGASLSGVFEKFADENGLAKGTVRNVYYDLLKRSETDGYFRAKYFGDVCLSAAKIVEFDNIEARWLMKKILLGATFGKPVRRIVSEITDDPKKALRYQNKYRNMLKTDKDVVEDVMHEIKTEFGRCYNPYDKGKEDVALTRLKSEINDLYDRITDKMRVENERLKARIAFLESENSKLRNMITVRQNLAVKDYFENVNSLPSKTSKK